MTGEETEAPSLSYFPCHTAVAESEFRPKSVPSGALPTTPVAFLEGMDILRSSWRIGPDSGELSDP